MKVFLFLFVLSFFTPELVGYKNDEYRFEVQFPKEFQTENHEQEEKFGSTKYVKVTGRDGGGGYTVVATRYESSEAFKKKGLNFQELIINHAKYLSQESFLKNNFVILAENHTQHILEYVVGEVSSEMGMIRRIYIRKGMTYSLSIYAHKDFLRHENVEPFFKSLKIKPE